MDKYTKDDAILLRINNIDKEVLTKQAKKENTSVSDLIAEIIKDYIYKKKLDDLLSDKKNKIKNIDGIKYIKIEKCDEETKKMVLHFMMHGRKDNVYIVNNENGLFVGKMDEVKKRKV